MRKSRLGCLSGSGLITGLVTLLLITGIAYARGGVMFSPGELNAQTGSQPLGGVISHADTGGRCEACHTAIWDQDSMADRCLVCHTDLITNQQSFHSVMLAQSEQLPCQKCHTDHRGPQAALTSFEMERFPHNDVGGFALDSHQRLADGSKFTCETCHGEQIALFEQTTCLECHQDMDATFMSAHSQEFAPDCLACHDGVDTYGKSFDHNRTPFPLLGEHQEIACMACHPNARARADLQATPTDCFACHAQDDAHMGQLGQACYTCHTPQDWEQITFDHNLASFPLTGKHQAIGCEDCHQNGIFIGISTDCFACHAMDDPHAGQLGQDCAACHSTDGWTPASFDHSRATFQLTGAHLEVACENCHQDLIFKGTPANCFACHAEDDEHDGRFGQDCAMCHNTTDWEDATFDHNLASFKLTGAHVNASCTACHKNNVFIGTASACSACHADPDYHRGLFSASCDSCHSTNAWSPAQFNASHRFPLGHGKGNRNCDTCHPGTLHSYTCYGCHEHNPGKIESKHRDEGISNFKNCVKCHPTGREADGDGGGEDGGGGED